MRAQGGIRQFTSRTACTAVGPEPKVRLTLVHSTRAGSVVTVSMAASARRDYWSSAHPSVVEAYDAGRGGGDRGAVAGDQDRGAAGGGVGQQVQHP